MNFAIILFMGTFALLHLLHAVDGAAAQLQVRRRLVSSCFVIYSYHIRAFTHGYSSTLVGWLRYRQQRARHLEY